MKLENSILINNAWYVTSTTEKKIPSRGALNIYF